MCGKISSNPIANVNGCIPAHAQNAMYGISVKEMACTYAMKKETCSVVYINDWRIEGAKINMFICQLITNYGQAYAWP